MVGEHEITSWEDIALTYQATPNSLKCVITAALVLMVMSKGTYLRYPILTKLPAEIVLCVMEELKSPTDLISLILTARVFNDLWKRHTHTISTAVLNNSLDCYPDAKALDEIVHPEPPFGFPAASARHTRMIRAAQYISYMYELFKSNYRRAPFPNKNGDRIWFQTSFYFLWQHVVTASYKPFRFRHQSHVDDSLPLPPEDSILTLCELIVWIRLIRDRAAASDRIFRRANRIYRRRSSRDNNNNSNIIIRDNNNSSSSRSSPKNRLSQSKRWSSCCAAVWYHPWFEVIRKDYWARDLRLHTPEPGGWYPGDPYFHVRPRLLGFLAWAREVRVWRIRVERMVLGRMGG